MGIRPETVFMPQTTLDNTTSVPVTSNSMASPPFYPQNLSTPLIGDVPHSPQLQHPLMATSPAVGGGRQLPQQQTQVHQPVIAQAVGPQNEQGAGDGGAAAQAAGAAGAGPVGGDAVAENRPQPRFPNIVVEEPPENRDWLDMFYTMSRLIIFMTLVYFYSSPVRCALVLFIAFVGYL